MYKMMNHDDQEDLRRQSKTIVILLKELDYKNHKLIEMGKKKDETIAAMKRLIMGLMENISSRERCNEFQRLKAVNNNMIRDMECLEKEHKQLTEKLKETKTLNDLQQRSFIEEIKSLRRELQDQYVEENCSSLATQLNTFRQQLKGKMERLGHVESMCSSVIVKECQYKQELVDAREESVKEIVDENDEKLKALRTEYGEMVYKAVADALMELQQYNASARYPVPIIWNRKEERGASLKEVIQYIAKQLHSCRRKRKRN